MWIYESVDNQQFWTMINQVSCGLGHVIRVKLEFDHLMMWTSMNFKSLCGFLCLLIWRLASFYWHVLVVYFVFVVNMKIWICFTPMPRFCLIRDQEVCKSAFGKFWLMINPFLFVVYPMLVIVNLRILASVLFSFIWVLNVLCLGP